MNATPKQKTYIRALGKKVGQDIEISELDNVSTVEANKIIRSLREAAEGIAVDDLQVMRMKIISMARSINWQKQGEADMPRIEKWCMTYGKYKKGLNAHTKNELGILISQFQNGPFQHALQKG